MANKKTNRDSNGRFVKGHSLGERFKKGKQPWNKGMKGYTNLGSFKIGHEQLNTGRTRFKKQGEFFIDEKGYAKTHVDGKKRKIHHLIWEKHNGKIPKGYVIHHKDGDKLNNKIENLKLMTNGEHTKLHWKRGDINGN